MPLVHKMNNMSLHFETLSHNTGGNTFIIQPNKPNLDVYMDILDALREIRRRSESNGPSLVSVTFLTASLLISGSSHYFF